MVISMVIFDIYLIYIYTVVEQLSLNYGAPFIRKKKNYIQFKKIQQNFDALLVVTDHIFLNIEELSRCFFVLCG